jgi:uncharacterized membrane protein YfcA
VGLDPAVLLVVLFAVSVVASVINTMAGGGSMLVVPVLLALGLPAPVANGTLRVGVLAQNLASALTFHGRREPGTYAAFARLVVPVAVGAAAGSFAATRVPADALTTVFGVALAIWAIVLAIRPGGFTAERSEPRPIGVLHVLGAIAVGAYGGFLQVGVGFPLLALLVPGLGFAPVQANAIKILLVFAYTLVSLPLFAAADQVAWLEGAVLAAGAIVGGWLGVRWQLRAGASIVRWFVIVTVCIAGIAMILR